MSSLALLALLVAAEPTVPQYDIESVRVRYTQYAQTGLGYQSAAGPPGKPGSEWLRVEQPQAEVTARLDERVTERIWVPVDIVTAASPDHSRFGKPYDAVDTVTAASRTTPSSTLDTFTTYRADRATDLTMRAAFHIEEPFESWIVGLGASRSFAEDNTVVGVSANQILDWFDRFDLDGNRHGRATRSTTNLNADVTQVLSPTTLANLAYGGTLQTGELGNTWQSVLLSDMTRGEERLPGHRWRHAAAARLAQWLPWEGALTLSYRLYLDSWGIAAHSAEGALAQRVHPGVVLRASYRFHVQDAPAFFTTAADPMASGFRTSDSDLGPFHAQTFGGAVLVDLPLAHRAHDVHVDIGYERYVRSDNLRVDIATCGLGFRF
ncbi:MAG TPA: DUF3570 domain-containing protein [Polyangia bacterium]|nr:DUF3570 domain-containing protein [Polyangia bacterium]